MLTKLIDLCLRNRWLVLLGTLLAAGVGVYSLLNLGFDAFPDTTPVQVQVNTVAPALSPEEVETQITAPVEQALAGLPKLTAMRSKSQFGLSQVVVLFADGTDVYFARQQVAERLATAQLPAGVNRPVPGPAASGQGEVFHYIVSGNTDDPTELRTLHDWVIRPQLRRVPGTAEVNSWGGFERQWHVRPDPLLLAKYDLTFDDVAAAVEANNRTAGGGSVTAQGQFLLVQGHARTTTAKQIEDISVRGGRVPVRVKDVAAVEPGYEVRRGAVTFDGRGEVVLGLGFSAIGENTHAVTGGMKAKLDDIRPTLPRNTAVTPVYDRTELVEQVINTVRGNLFEGGLLVVVILFAFLGRLRAAAIVALAIPLSLLFAFTGMARFGIAASLLSLGAIDFGMVVDSSVVMVENCVKKLGENAAGRPKLDVIRDAAVEVRKPTLFGELIIMVVYLPILTLEGTEGKLFRPMALTILFALAGSMVLSLTLMPVLASLLLPKRAAEREPLLMQLAHAIHRPVLALALRFRWAVVAFGGLVLAFAFGFVLPNLGTEFVPPLSEGSIAINITRPAGTDLAEGVRMNTLIEKAILEEFPDEVAHVWNRVGTGDIATDPMGVELTDTYLTLKPRSNWKRAKTQEELTDQLRELIRTYPGQQAEFNQPIAMRIAEMETGTRAAVSVQVYGDDFEILKDQAKKVEAALTSVPGAADVKTEPTADQPVLRVTVNQDAVARYGMTARQVLAFVESLGGKSAGEVQQGPIRVPLVVRLPDEYRTRPDAVDGLLVPTPNGERVPLGRLAKVQVAGGPSSVTREGGQRRLAVTCNVKDRDLGTFVEEAQKKVNAAVSLPPGRYHLEWAGQYNDLIRARNRMLFVVLPLTAVLVVSLLFVAYRNWDALRVLTAVPFAWVGGLVALWVRGMPLSVSALVGFVALSGVAVMDDMILVSAVRRLRSQGVPLEEAAVSRLRPVLMTALVAGLGFVPMAFGDGVGSEVQRPLATVVIGGVAGSFVMSLLVVRVLYLVFSSAGRKASAAGGEVVPLTQGEA